MPPRITREDAARIAGLAKIELTDAELDRAATELDAILGYFDVIARIDTAGIDPSSGLQAAPPLRPDAPGPSLSPADAFVNAPDADPESGLFRVPRVLG
jgi:aspartyl-tRNA(Asn)/glutamyl-tRNA(Gln) amidotransferase subunit C